jgi:hypothetical protein
VVEALGQELPEALFVALDIVVHDDIGRYARALKGLF